MESSAGAELGPRDGLGSFTGMYASYWKARTGLREFLWWSSVEGHGHGHEAPWKGKLWCKNFKVIHTKEFGEMRRDAYQARNSLLIDWRAWIWSKCFGEKMNSGGIFL